MSTGRARSKLVVVGGGVAGLAAAHRAMEVAPDLDVVLLERERRTGGLVDSERTPDGLLLEWGPDSMLTEKPAGVVLARRVGLGDALVCTARSGAFVALGGRLERIPDGMMAMAPSSLRTLATTSLFSIPGKLRMALEPFVRTRDSNDDESVESFIVRRFGREMLDRFVEPLLCGIHACEPDQLSVRASLPRLVRMEREHGSITAAMARMPRRAPPVERPGAPRKLTWIAAFRDGMEMLPATLARRLGDRVRLGVHVRSIERGPGRGFVLRLSDGATLEADGVVVALPVHIAARVLEPLSTRLASMLGTVEHSPALVASLAYKRADVADPLDGTGFVVPRKYPAVLNACTWSSRKFDHRAPADRLLFRCFVRWSGAPDEELLAGVRKELRDLMGIDVAPDYWRFRRIEKAIPRYHVGHLDYVARLDELADSLGAIALAGNAYGGIGIPDCVLGAESAADRVAAVLCTSTPSARNAPSTSASSPAS